ncbi:MULTISPECIES: gas vesicle protein GvpJ [unclassified Streptomyces]|uniref:gas vesicle protein GvpJ n=1 Tax=unclassified Streptomyces TaxID=2593676 RepID=UPI000BAC538F|nr:MULTISPECIES: gas vesicle protein GvpJ [unclassified Streptomyces]ASY35434.1 gas vesicle protein [Streptomyces sp. CLI2509]MYX24413.1 gas vesicle structural protein GvpA [Streptomyces sp. SID8380]
MTIQTEYADPGAVLCAPRAGTLYDVLELILDRGMVIDIFVRVSLVGIEILKIDARVVVASVDTYLRFAEACNRVDLSNDPSSRTVPELFAGGKAGLAGVGAKRAVHSVGDKVRDTLGIDGGVEGAEDRGYEREPARRRPAGATRRRKGEAA